MKRVLAVIVALFVSAAASGQDMPAPVVEAGVP
jgi:hypothetical protein